MKILHVVFTYWPDSPAGTEVYVGALCRQLRARGVECLVAAPGPVDREYVVDEVRVRRFVCDPSTQSLDTLYGAGDPVASRAFERVLDEERPDVVHQHALSPACSVALVRGAARRGLPVVFTYHTPAVSCQRGTLLRFGTTVCEGAWREDICTPCVLEGLGAGAVARGIASRVPVAVGRAVGRMGLGGGAWTAVRMPALMRQRLDAVRELFATVSRVVSLSPWTTRLFEMNGVASERIVYSPHGIAGWPIGPHHVRDASRNVRLAHLGRLDPTKGTDVLIRALRSQPSLAVILDVFGLEQTGMLDRTATDLRALAHGDSRITFRAPMAQADVGPMLRRYDAIVVPSQWLETGPLVVLEAFAAGVPVIGSRLGGIADKVRDGVDGLLVSPFDDEAAWAAAIRRCVEDPGLLDRLRRGVDLPRAIDEVACEMVEVYDAVLSGTQAAST